MEELQFKKLFPRTETGGWKHPSAIWALKDYPFLQIGKTNLPGQIKLAWMVTIEKEAARQAPQWIKTLASQGRHEWQGMLPEILLLFPGCSFASKAEAIEALDSTRVHTCSPELAEALDQGAVACSASSRPKP